MVNNIESTVISSRVRLARNLADYPFPNKIRDAAVSYTHLTLPTIRLV
mgnify:CR=1 FL=1